MMTNQPYPEELKIKAVKQITERGHRAVEVDLPTQDRVGREQIFQSAVFATSGRASCMHPRPALLAA